METKSCLFILFLPESSSPASAVYPSIGEVGAAQPPTDKTIPTLVLEMRFERLNELIEWSPLGIPCPHDSTAMFSRLLIYRVMLDSVLCVTARYVYVRITQGPSETPEVRPRVCPGFGCVHCGQLCVDMECISGIIT
ncbi:hypothetical protein P167DRAFT_327885 [Morchella conica CCBAS932]|uniref:4Fe-4S ferredoxin-type domain-containing protein n=1 Tax=Morchella conica CCBAS932 TaxID=1392247 RepID=A0A3N4KTH4_9PEZI|nr:hypothetical protein P167DRAFT_327885 [Morchella conica CCBAS932]